MNVDIFETWQFAAASTTEKEQEQAGTLDSANNTMEENVINEMGQGNKTTIPDARQKTENKKEESKTTSISQIEIEALSPLRKAPAREVPRKRKRGETCVINSTPDVEELKSKKQESLEKERKKLARTAKKTLVKETIEKEGDQENAMQDLSDEDSDVSYLYCNELYSQSRPKVWIKCLNCKRWCHADCAGVTKSIKMFICDVCK